MNEAPHALPVSVPTKPSRAGLTGFGGRALGKLGLLGCGLTWLDQKCTSARLENGRPPANSSAARLDASSQARAQLDGFTPVARFGCEQKGNLELISNCNPKVYFGARKITNRVRLNTL